MILSAAAQLIFAHNKALVSYIRVLQKSSQFTRAIRKTASAMLSAAMQLIFAHEPALPSYIRAVRFLCEHKICPQECMSELYVNFCAFAD